MTSRTWSPSSWRGLTALQQPDWPDLGALDVALKRLSLLPPLVFAGEARHLTNALGRVGTFAEIAEACMFFASEDASYTSGVSVNGLTMQSVGSPWPGIYVLSLTHALHTVTIAAGATA